MANLKISSPTLKSFVWGEWSEKLKTLNAHAPLLRLARGRGIDSTCSTAVSPCASATFSTCSTVGKPSGRIAAMTRIRSRFERQRLRV